MDLRSVKPKKIFSFITEIIPDLPENSTVGETVFGGDCFFDSVAQSLRHIRPDEEFSTKSIREICRSYALKYDWVKRAVATDARLKSSLKETIQDSDLWKKYLFAIEYTSEDMEKMKDNEEYLLYAALTESQHGDTLLAPIWGKCEIEGRIICDKYNVKLHVIEKHDVKGQVRAHHIVDRSCSRSVDNVNYNEEDTIHIVKTGNLHFRPLLLKPYSSHKSEQHSQHSKQQNNFDYNGRESPIKSVEYWANTENVSDSARKESIAANELKLGNNSSSLCPADSTADENVWSSLDNALLIDDEESESAIQRVAKQDVNPAIKQLLCEAAEVSVTPYQMERSDKKRFHRKKGTAGASGHFYEIKLSTFLFLKGISEKIEYFYLASNLDEAHTFDDIVFKYKYVGSDKPKTLFIQTKHKDELQEKDDNQATFKSKISFQKFFASYLKIRQQFSDVSVSGPIFEGSFDDCDFIIYTNLPPGPRNGQGDVTEAKGFLKVTASEDSMFNFFYDKGSDLFNHYYMINDESKSKEILNNLYNASDCMQLARELAKSVFRCGRNCDELEINLMKDIFKKYRIPLAQNVFEMGGKADRAMFRESFLDGSEGLSVHDREFRRAFLEEAEKFNRKNNGHLKSELRRKDIKVSKKFWNTDYVKRNEQPKLILPSDSVHANDIKEFLGKLKLFINQPNEEELEKIIRRIVQEMYRIEQPDVDSVFLSLKDKITKWWQKADYYLTKEEKFLEDIVRVSIFTVEEHVESFTGRENELRQLHCALQRNDAKHRITVISQITAISGLGGIGKTELARKYAWDYQHWYDGNVLWINAESSISLKNSFLRLAQHPRISIPTEYKNGKEKPVACVVSEIYDFFAKRKSLFIFDNAETSRDVNQFLPLHPLTPDPNKPYILITSREREWKRGIEVIEIKDLELKDAVEFVGKYINIAEASEQEIRVLVDTLQCFPLALQQAVAHIAHQRTVGKFSIRDYLKEYKIQKERFLKSTAFQGIGSSYTQTTYTTWQITMDKIKKDRNCGRLAIEILNIASYLTPEYIEREFFYNLADIVDEDVKEAVRLLVNYSMLGADEHQTMLSIHRLVQHVTRLNLEKQKLEQRVLRKALKLISVFAYADNVISVWSYASKHGKLIDEFFFKYSDSYVLDSPLRTLAVQDKYQVFEAILEHIQKKHPKKFREIINEGHWKSGETLLHRTVMNRNLDAVKYLVTHGAIVDDIGNCGIYFDDSSEPPEPTGHSINLECIYDYMSLKEHFQKRFSFTEVTPLHCAAYSGNEDMVSYLISKGANVKAVNQMNATPLHAACISGNINVVKLLLAKGANVNDSGPYETPLDCASASGNRDLVKYLITAGADTEATRDIYRKYFTTPLHMAALAKKFDVLEYLLSNGANINVKDYYGRTPLHSVSEDGNLRSIEYLLDKGADFYSVDDLKRTPVHLAAETGHLDVVKLLYERVGELNLPGNDGDTLFHTAFRARQFDIVKFIVEEGVDLNIPNNHDDMPLHFILSRRNFMTEIFMIDCSVYFNFRCKNKRPPLHCAAQNFVTQLVKYLVENGADFTNLDSSGNTPLHLAAANNYTDEVQYLMGKGADFQSPNNSGRTPIHLAAGLGFHKFFQLFGRFVGITLKPLEWMMLAHDIVRILMENGANFEALDGDNRAPIHLAAEASNIDVVQLLVEKGADFKSPDKYGSTPLHLAVGKCNKDGYETVRILIDNGANLNAIDRNNRAPIHLAAEVRDTAVVKLLIEKGADFKSPDKYGSSPLHLAVGKCHKDGYETVRILIDNGANLHAVDRNNRAPIHLAAKANDTAAVKHLIEKGADFNLVDKYGYTPLHLAVQKYHKCGYDTVRILIGNGANFETLDDDNRAPIHSAAKTNNTAVVKLLIEKGADFKSPDKYGYTPLHWAVGNNHLDVVRLFLEKGVDVNLPDEDGNTALHLAYANYSRDMVKLLKLNGAGSEYHNNYGNVPINSAVGAKTGQRLFSEIFNDNRSSADKMQLTPIHRASAEGLLKAVVSLVKKGADFTVRDKHGCTPLHVAALRNHCNVVEFLIRKGADFDCRDSNRNTPLHSAIAAGERRRRKLDIGIEKECSDAAKYLINKGARLDFPDNSGRTPMHWAAKKRKFEVLRLLVEKGIDFNCLDRDQKTPVHYAAQIGSLASVKYLIEKGADLNSIDKNNRTPMQWAAREGHLDIVKFLVRKGADFNLCEKNGNTPLHVAASYGHFYISKFLLSEVVDINCRGNSGNTPLHLASRRGRLNIIILLVEKGCDLHVKNRKGRTPLHCAVSSGKLNVVKYLITKNAVLNIEAKDYSGNTLLSSAAASGKLMVVKFLIEKRNASFKTTNNSGDTPLHLAALKGAFFVIKYLVQELQADFNAINNVGNTPLHLAAQKGSLDIVKYLIEVKNVYSKAHNISGETPLHLAVRKGSVHVVKYLTEDKNCVLNVPNYFGDTPLRLPERKTQH